jgi:ferredoxin
MVQVDRDVCMGSGMCVVYASEWFDIDDEAKAVFTKGGDTSLDSVRTAVEACPTGALTLVEASPASAGTEPS